MADGTKIEWSQHPQTGKGATWNPVTGCSLASPGCIHCYAQRLAGTRMKHHPSRKGLTDDTKNGPVFNGKVRFNEQWLTQPLQWKTPRGIFVCAHGDLFHENVPDEWIDKVFAVMALAPQHIFMVLTKRAARMRAYLSYGPRRTQIAAHAHVMACGFGGDPEKFSPERAAGVMRIQYELVQGTNTQLPTSISPWPLPNVWLGVSAERQKEADERIPHLLRTPAAKRFLSAEPLLESVNLAGWLGDTDCGDCDDNGLGMPGRCARDDVPREEQCPERRAVFIEHVGPLDDDNCPKWIKEERRVFDWVIVGGESGNGARPMHPDWARSLRDQCKAAGVPFFFKQWGEFEYETRSGTEVELSKLAHNERAMWGDGKSNHVICRDVGKKAAGRLLDGVEHSEWPA